MIDDQYDEAFGPTPDPLDEPLPLSQWVRGTARLLFRDQAVLEFEMTQGEAGELTDIVSGQREGSVRHWSDLRWLTIDEDRVEAVTFEPHPDMGWPLTAHARLRQQEAGHPSGVLRTLHQYWASRAEPKFSFNALLALSALAEYRPPAHVCRVSTAMEGQEGARRAAAVWKEADAMERESRTSDDATTRSGRATAPSPDLEDHPTGSPEDDEPSPQNTGEDPTDQADGAHGADGADAT